MSDSLRGRVAAIEREMRIGKSLPEGVKPEWFEGLPPGRINGPPPGVVLTPAQRETFDIVAAMHNSMGYGPEDGYETDT